MAQMVTAPQRQARVGGIKSVVNFTPEPRLGMQQNFAWEDSGCGFPNDTRAGCYDDVVAAVAKTFDGVEEYGIITPPFAQYVGVSCYIGGDADSATYEQQAKDKLAATEDRKVEEVLGGWAAASTATADVTDLVGALAAAEDHADQNYVGRPYVLLNRGDAVQLKSKGVLEVAEDGKIRTANGNEVISSGRFPVNTVSAVGAIGVYVGPEVSATAPDLENNLNVALAERVYAVGVDCGYRFTATV